MIKNILVKGLCTLNSKTQIEPPALFGHYDLYTQMHNISVDSYKNYLQGNWELVVYNKAQENIIVYFKNLLIFIKDLWHHNYPCNIMYTDADTLCIKPLDIFEKFIDFRLFTDKDPISPHDYFNCGIRYYPSSLPKSFWNDTESMLDNWDDSKWDYEQYAYKSLMLAQKNFDLHRPQGWIVTQIGFNHSRLIHEVNIDRLRNLPQSVLHFHSSQYPQFRLEAMQFVWDNFK